MRLKKAPLILKEFYILDSTYQFNEPVNEEVDISEVFDQYPIEFDFKINKDENDNFFLYTKITINQPINDKAFPGYLISVESISILGFNTDNKLTEKERKDFIFMSGLSIAINNLRAYILNMTSYYPFGRYQLPAIDMVQLHKDKNEQIKKSKKK